jgi:hypothetical protein
VSRSIPPVAESIAAEIYALLDYTTALRIDLHHTITFLEQQDEASMPRAEEEWAGRLERASRWHQELVQAIQRLAAELDPNVSSSNGYGSLLGSALGNSGKDAAG